MDEKVDFDRLVAHIDEMVGDEASVVISGRDAGGLGAVAELTGILRSVGPDPDDPAWGTRGPRVYGFESQKTAFYIDPDAYVDASISGGFVHVDMTFGSVEIAGPIDRPNWF
jgi:hypothetical protein